MGTSIQLQSKRKIKIILLLNEDQLGFTVNETESLWRKLPVSLWQKYLTHKETKA